MDWLSLLLPFIYLGVLVTSLYTFSHLYRSRKAAQARALAPWFEPNLQRNVYLSLLELQAEPNTKVPDSILKAALLRRANEDMHRLVSVRNSKPALSQLLQRGSVGDELWQRFLKAEKEISAELKEVAEEANALAPQQNWGNLIFQSAAEIAHNEMLRNKLQEIEARREVEKRQFEARRESVRDGFMKELESEKSKPEANGVEHVEIKKPSSSDGDTVVVESGGPGEASPPHSVVQEGSAKKKKGKK